MHFQGGGSEACQVANESPKGAPSLFLAGQNRTLK